VLPARMQLVSAALAYPKSAACVWLICVHPRIQLETTAFSMQCMVLDIIRFGWRTYALSVKEQDLHGKDLGQTLGPSCPHQFLCAVLMYCTLFSKALLKLVIGSLYVEVFTYYIITFLKSSIKGPSQGYELGNPSIERRHDFTSKLRRYYIFFDHIYYVRDILLYNLSSDC
jgi:hypothetical protein